MKNFPYQAVLFDMDGTIADTDMMVVLTYFEMYRRFRPSYKPSLKKLMYFSGPPLKDVFPVEFPDVPFEEALAFFRETAKKYYVETVTAYPGVKKILQSLKKKGIKTAVVTGKMHREADLTLYLIGLTGLFDVLVCSDDVATSKPNPEGVNKALSELGVSKENALFIGDTEYDYQTSRNAKTDTMIVTWTPRNFPKKLKPDYYLDTWDDFFKVIENGKQD